MDLNSQFVTFLIAAAIFYTGVVLTYVFASPAIKRIEELDKH